LRRCFEVITEVALVKPKLGVISPVCFNSTDEAIIITTQLKKFSSQLVANRHYVDFTLPNYETGRGVRVAYGDGLETSH
jgi:hypothetical protein